jgi:hypothetical protein
MLLMPERDDPDAFGLRHASEVRDRDTRYAVDRFDAVELECVDDEMKAISQLPLFVGSRHGLLDFHDVGHAYSSSLNDRRLLAPLVLGSTVNAQISPLFITAKRLSRFWHNKCH